MDPGPASIGEEQVNALDGLDDRLNQLFSVVQ